MTLLETQIIFSLIYACCAPLEDHHLGGRWTNYSTEHPTNIVRTRSIKSVEACRLQLQKCHLDDKQPLDKCLRSMNLSEK